MCTTKLGYSQDHLTKPSRWAKIVYSLDIIAWIPMGILTIWTTMLRSSQVTNDKSIKSLNWQFFWRLPKLSLQIFSPNFPMKNIILKVQKMLWLFNHCLGASWAQNLIHGHLSDFCLKSSSGCISLIRAVAWTKFFAVTAATLCCCNNRLFRVSYMENLNTWNPAMITQPGWPSG